MSLNSPYGKIFQAIMTRIQAEVPEIKHIDQDMGQLEGFSTRPSVAFPCILVDFKNWTFDDLTLNVQMAQGDVIVKFAYAQFTPSSDKVDDTFREQALQYYELEWKLNQALHGWSPGDEFSVMSRRSNDSQTVVPGIRVRPLTYRMEFEDYSTETQDTVAHPGMGFQGEID